MRELLNQNSFLFVAALLLVVAVPLLWRFAPGSWRWVGLGALLVGLLAFQLTMRTGSTFEEVRAAFSASDEPVLLELYSDF